MRFLSLCSGIEAASVAWAPMGWKAAAFAEIEAFPSAVLAHHYPNVPNLGDITKFKEWPDLGPVDIVCGGTPCQSFSVAGLRKGLADPRGNLSLTFLAVVDKYQPRYVAWENVPGVLSSTSYDAPVPCPPPPPVDMGCDGAEVETEDEFDSEEVHALNSFLAGLSELGYGWAYVVRDAQYIRVDGFGRAVPQRRRRVFVVGCLGDWRRAAAVLFEPESLHGDSPPSRKTGSGTAVGALAGTSPGGGWRVGADEAAAGQLVASTGNVAHCLNAGGMGRQDFETETMIASRTVAATLTRGAESAGKGGYAGRRQEDDENLVAIPFDTTQITSSANYSRPQSGDPCHPLAAGAHPPAIAIQAGALRENPVSGPDGIGIQSDIAYTVEARAEVQAVAYNITPSNSNQDYNAREAQYAQAVTTQGGAPSARGGDIVASGWSVRRLTPTECARLQGFPDDYLSQVTWRGKCPPPDGPMYKAFGNSWPVNFARWVGRRIEMVEQIAADIDQERAA